MAYIGKQPGTGVRNRFLYTATAGQTTFTTSDSSQALSYSDGLYVDVYLNGVLLDPANDYTATSGTSVVLGAGASAGDVLEVVVYDVFSVFDGTVNGNLTVTEDLTVDTNTLHVDSTNNRVGVGTTSPENPIEIETTNKLGGTFTGTTDGEGLRVTQTDYTSGNYVSLVEAPYDDSQTAANVRIGAMFDGGGSHIAFGTSNSYGAGITNTAMFIDQVGFVGVGNTAPDTTLDVSGSGVPFEVDSTNSNTYKVQFKNNGTVTSYFGTAADSFFFANSSATQLARIDSDGIKFGTDSAAANGLGDYEEGTWTPVYQALTSNPTVTHSVQLGRYVKIGAFVNVTFRIQTSAASGGSGALVIGGLPFASTNVSSLFASGPIGFCSAFTNFAPQTLLVGNNSTQIQLIRNSGTNGYDALGTSITTGELNNASGANDLIGALSYRTDS